MDIKKYKVLFTITGWQELVNTFNYISNNLLKRKVSQKLMNKIEDKINLLEYTPKIYPKIERKDELGRVFRKIALKQNVILYTIDENEREVYISHVFYQKSDYLNKI